MPVCPNCRIAYLAGESHDCRDFRPVPTIRSTVARGTLLGATVGVLVLLTQSLLSQNPGLLARVMDSLVTGSVVGGLTGGSIGAIIAERRTRHH